MAKKADTTATDYPDFDGWAVTKNPNRNELVAVKEHPDAPNGRMVVRALGGDLDRVYLVLKQDAAVEEHRLTGTPDTEAKATAAARALVIAKVKAGLAAGYDEDYAVKRLRAAGVPFADMASVIGAATKE